MKQISPERIQAASRTIDPVFLNSPQVEFDSLSEATGASVVLKVETLNPIRCFKGRGSDYFTACLTARAPLVLASAGNFGQGMAYAARKRGMPVYIFAPEKANPLKVQRMRQLGAKVLLQGVDFDESKIAARAYAAEHGYRFVEDGAEPEIAEGAGTIALELAREHRFDAVVAPVGNGALISGIGCWLKSHSAGTKVIGVCPANAPAMERSWRSGQLTTTDTAETIADGLAVRIPVPFAVEEMRAFVDEVLLVSEQQILEATRALFRFTGLVAEPSGATGLAGIQSTPASFRGQRVATPICGANVTEEQIRSWF
jgi:threonine dehydratase